MRWIAPIMGALLVAACVRAETPLTAPAKLNGLQCALVPDQTSVSMGSRIAFDLNFTFDPSSADPKTRFLNLSFGDYLFLFVNTETRAAYKRSWVDDSGPFIPRPEDQVPLSVSQPARATGIKVPLLSEHGEQVPPGKYQVRVLYSNEIQPLVVYGAEKSDPSQFWQGTIESLPCSVDVLPAKPENVIVEVPTKFLRETTSMPRQFGGLFDKESMKKIRVLVRPGFTVCNRWKFRAGGINEPVGWISSNTWQTDGPIYLPPDQSASLLTKGAELIIDLEIFETSRRIEFGRGLFPELGDFKVLWTVQIRQ